MATLLEQLKSRIDHWTDQLNIVKKRDHDLKMQQAALCMGAGISPDIVQGFMEHITAKEMQDNVLSYYEEKIQSRFLKDAEIKAAFNEPELNQAQLEQIYWGIQNQLSLKQIEVYAKHIFSPDQMFAMRHALEEGLTIKEVSRIADPHINARNMNYAYNQLIQAKAKVGIIDTPQKTTRNLDDMISDVNERKHKQTQNFMDYSNNKNEIKSDRDSR